MMMPWREYKIECVLFNSRIYFTSCEFYFISLCWYANFKRSWAKAKYIKWIRFQLLFQLLTKVHWGMPYKCLHNFKKYCIVFASHQGADRKKIKLFLKQYNFFNLTFLELIPKQINLFLLLEYLLNNYFNYYSNCPIQRKTTRFPNLLLLSHEARCPHINPRGVSRDTRSQHSNPGSGHCLFPHRNIP